MANSPTLVLIPGSWHRSTCYDKVTKLLEVHHKLKCVAITLPSTTGNPEASFKDDMNAAQAAISNETRQGRNVVVIAHSYGGLVGSSAIKGFTKPQDASVSQDPSPTSGYVIGLILIATGFAITGLAFMDPFFGHPPPSWRVNSATGYAEIVTPPREFFYHDLPADEADYWVSQLTTQSLKALFEGGEYVYAGWRDVPVWYIGTVEDQGLPVLVQRMQVGMARAMGTSVEHRELQTSHSPFLSQPELTAKIIAGAAEAFTGEPREDDSTDSRRDTAITVPRATLWKPSAWLRFGLPLGFGHVLGKGFLLFYWARSLWRANSD